ncbi:MAG: hypothetical protein RIC89_10535 [Pseudomonadales bacterium]
MSQSTQDISNLLALRDGEPVDTERPVDPEMLAAVQEIKQSLNAMPDVPLGEFVLKKRKKPKWQHYPLSTAASVFLVSAVVVFGLVSGVGELLPARTANVAAIEPADPSGLVALMDRSQDLERLAYETPVWQPSSTPGTTQGLEVSPLGEFILFQLAEVDQAIAEANLDDELTAQLWQQRVNLLQAFLTEMEAQNPGRFEDNRSM